MTQGWTPEVPSSPGAFYCRGSPAMSSTLLILDADTGMVPSYEVVVFQAYHVEISIVIGALVLEPDFDAKIDLGS